MSIITRKFEICFPVEIAYTEDEYNKKCAQGQDFEALVKQAAFAKFKKKIQNKVERDMVTHLAFNVMNNMVK